MSPADTAAITAALKRAIDPVFRKKLSGMTNPYGTGNAAKTIAKVLTSVPLENLLIKQPAPLTVPDSRSRDLLTGAKHR